MMKSLIGFLAAILISIASTAQTNSKPNKIYLSDSIVGQMIDELIVKDHLQFTVNKLDSTVTIYKHTIEEDKQEIVKLKLNAKDYEQTIKYLNEIIISKDQEIASVKKASIKGKIISFIEGFGVCIVLVITYVVAHKE